VDQVVERFGRALGAVADELSRGQAVNP